MGHFLDEMKERFPRLKEVEFTECDKDEHSVEATPAGEVEAVYFYMRQDFETAVIALPYKLEPRPIPASMGACFVSGLADHVNTGKTNLIILSRGGYSGLSAENVREAYRRYGRDESKWEWLSDEKWDDLSLVIRKNHELTHFVQRKLFPENKNALKDEIKADMAGIIAAAGCYDGFLARLFLGIEGDEYRRGGRLENYLAEGEDITAVCTKAETYISALEQKIGKGNTENIDGRSCFDVLIDVEKSEQEENRADKT